MTYLLCTQCAIPAVTPMATPMARQRKSVPSYGYLAAMAMTIYMVMMAMTGYMAAITMTGWLVQLVMTDWMAGMDTISLASLSAAPAIMGMIPSQILTFR